MSIEIAKIHFHQDVDVEFDYARERWAALDDENTINDYVTYIAMYASDAAKVALVGDLKAQRAMLVKVANLAMTAAVRIDTGTMPERPIDLDTERFVPDGHAHGQGRAFEA